MNDLAPQSLVKSWLACRAASHTCALPLESVVETMRPLPLEAFPKAPPFVAGMAIVRGMPTPVVSMRALMGEAASAFGRFVTVRINGRPVALAFDEVVGIHRLPDTTARELPPLLKNVAGETITEVSVRDSDLLLFLEASRIFPPGLIDTLMVEDAK